MWVLGLGGGTQGVEFGVLEVALGEVAGLELGEAEAELVVAAEGGVVPVAEESQHVFAQPGARPVGPSLLPYGLMQGLVQDLAAQQRQIPIFSHSWRGNQVHEGVALLVLVVEEDALVELRFEGGKLDGGGL